MAASLKDLFFNKTYMKAIGEQIAKSYPKFDQKLFLKKIFDNEWEEKELKQRLRHVSETINDVLNKPFPEAVGILLDVNENLSNNFTNMVFPEFVSIYGLDHFDESMFALKEMTRNSSSEFAVRHFIQKYGMDAMQYMYRWSKDENYHVRRLASEGCRPILPWSFKFHQFVQDPTPILPILNQLKEDPELYVQKSVANNLNDISKNHPELVLQICTEWNQINNKGTQFIVKRALRTMLKNGHQEALELFGVGDKQSIKITNFKVNEKTIRIGSQFTFSFDIEDTDFKQNQTQKINKKKLSTSRLPNKSKNSDISEDEDEDESYSPQVQKKKLKKQKQKEEEEEYKKQLEEELDDEEDEEEENSDNGLRIEYKIDYLKSNGTHSSKIFMMKNNYFLPKQKVTLEAKQRVQQLTTRKHYPGIHYISIIVNGTEKAKISFNLLKEIN